MDPLVAAMILQGFTFYTTHTSSWGEWRIFRPDGESMYYTGGWYVGLSRSDLGHRVDDFSEADWDRFPRITVEDRRTLTNFLQS